MTGANEKSGRGRRVVVRTAIAGALLASSFVVGVIGIASAAPPYHLQIIQPPSSTDASGAPLAVQPTVGVYDSSNVLQTGDSTSVTAAITSGGVSLGGTTTVAVNSGIATFTNLAVNAVAGGYTLTFTDGSYASVVSGTITVSVGTAKQLVITTQPSAGEVAGAALVQAPVVKVEDSGGNVVTTDTSSVSVASAGYTLAPSSVNAVGGVATFSGLTSNASAGNSFALTFTDGSLTQAVSGSIAVTGVATQLVITTQPASSDASGVALSPQPVVKIEDAAGRVVASDSSTVTAAINLGPVGSTVTGGTVTASAGVATFTNLALNALIGSYTLTFSDGSLTTVVSSSINVTTGGAAKLVIVTQPSSAVASGSALSQQPILKIEDSGGNLVSSTSSVTATFTSGGVSIVNPTVAAVGGVVTFSALTLNAPAGSYTLTFTDGALTPAVSTSIAIGTGNATQLVITTQPSSAVASGVALAQQPVVKIEDAGGNVVTTNTSTVTATVTVGTNTVTHNTAVAVGGIATFSGFTLTAGLGSYTLTFSDGSLTTAVSTSISVTSGAATHLVITTQPTSTDGSGTPLAAQPVVKIEDAGGNVVTSDVSTVTAKITSGGVSVTSGTAVAVGGVATFSGLALNALTGTYTLTFSDGSLTSAVSSNVTVITGNAAQLVITTEPSATATSGSVLAQHPVVKVEDTGGNVLTSLNSGYATASIYSGSGGSLSAGTTAPFSAGVATFSALALTGVSGSTYTLLYNGDGFNVIDSAKITVGTTQAALSLTSLNGVYGRSMTLTSSGGSGTGAVTYALSGGTAPDCSISGAVLTYKGVGTCIVTVTKAADATYLAAASAPTAVLIAKLPIPGLLRVSFNGNSVALSAAARTAIVALAKKLTVHSEVTITGFAPRNAGLARLRAKAAMVFLLTRVKFHPTIKIVTNTSLRVVQFRTTVQ